MDTCQYFYASVNLIFIIFFTDFWLGQICSTRIRATCGWRECGWNSRVIEFFSLSLLLVLFSTISFYFSSILSIFISIQRKHTSYTFIYILYIFDFNIIKFVTLLLLCATQKSLNHTQLYLFPWCLQVIFLLYYKFKVKSILDNFVIYIIDVRFNRKKIIFSVLQNEMKWKKLSLRFYFCVKNCWQLQLWIIDGNDEFFVYYFWIDWFFFIMKGVEFIFICVCFLLFPFSWWHLYVGSKSFFYELNQLFKFNFTVNQSWWWV